MEKPLEFGFEGMIKSHTYLSYRFFSFSAMNAGKENLSRGCYGVTVPPVLFKRQKHQRFNAISETGQLIVSPVFMFLS